jgi:uncharacterized protein YbjT (DUF2867 family)
MDPERDPERDADRPDRSGWRGNLILLTVCLLAVGTLCVAAKEFAWARDRALWAGLGAGLALLTLTRPWWFWENYKARGLRALIGDESTALVYLAVAGAMVWIGLTTNWPFGRR